MSDATTVHCLKHFVTLDGRFVDPGQNVMVLGHEVEALCASGHATKEIPEPPKEEKKRRVEREEEHEEEHRRRR